METEKRLYPDPEELEKIRRERTLAIVKPDGVNRHLVGEILSRFERKGFRIVGLKMLWPDKELASKHYTDDEKWLLGTGQRTYDNYMEQGVKPKLEPRELGLNTRRKLMEHMTAGPVVAIVLEGAHVIEAVRKMRGSTSPRKAEVGTIGFDFTPDSYELSDAGDWATKNVLHASDADTAEQEIALWFSEDELFDYDTAHGRVIYSKDWQQNRQPEQDG
jgi:nucleoside-diphosphate kinase